MNVKTLDNYCLKNKIHKIDFLKIDTEGFEIHVLEGAATMIENQAIDRIQLEHGSIQSIISQAFV
ncbi:FkbM family methyltransferase [Flavobacterium sp.]|uniref:FkbM family methyltransferase n=1 Tax=Flavobacterium sp. TaxID=239 RepID=UPI003528D3F1